MRALCSILFKLDNSLASPPHLWEADEEVTGFHDPASSQLPGNPLGFGEATPGFPEEASHHTLTAHPQTLKPDPEPCTPKPRPPKP